MSAVSNFYVHYFAENTKDNSYSGSTIKNYAENKVKKANLISGASKNSKQQYANILNAIFKRKSASMNSQNKDTRLAIEQIASEQFKNAVDINWVTGQVTRLVNPSSNGFLPTNQPISHVKAPHVVWSDTQINKIISEVNTLIANLNAAPNKYANQIKPVIASFNAILKQLQSLQNTSSANLNKLSAQAQSVAKRLKSNKNFPQFNSRTKWVDADMSIINAINSLIDNTFIIDQVAAIEQGDIFEMAGYYAAELAAGKTITDIYGAIKEGLSRSSQDLMSLKSGIYGQVKEPLEWRIDGIDAEVMANSFLKNAVNERQIGSMKVRTMKSSQQKIDVVGTFLDNSNQKIQVPMSLKSVNLQHSVSLVGGTSLWYLLQDEPIYYLNSYFNIMADHSQSLAKREKEKSKNRKRAYKYAAEVYFADMLKTQRKDAVFSAQLLSIMKAISGNTFLRQGAKLMVVNDTSSQRIYVFEIADIINALLQNSALNKGLLSTYVEGLSAFNYIFTNRWASNKHKRIAKIINEAHAIKISLAIKGSFLQSNVSKITST